jgi:hypothetical protein
MTDERRRNMKIVYGNLAYDLDTLVRERQLEEAGAMPERKAQPKEQTQPRRQPQAQAKARPSALLMGGIAVVCALVMVLLYSYVQLTTVSNHVSTIKSELATLEEEHVSLLTEYEKTFDLATVKAAAEEAGMSKPTSGQIQYIDLGGSDTAVVYSGEPGLMDKAVAAVKEGALSLWEYFR